MSAQTSNLTILKADTSVPSAERERLLRFCATHTVKATIVAGASWEYIACGRGVETLLILPPAAQSVDESKVQLSDPRAFMRV